MVGTAVGVNACAILERAPGRSCRLFILLVPAAGVEPATFRSGGERSNPLSYAGLNKIAGSKSCIKNVPLFVPLVNIGRLSVVILIV